MRKSKVWTETEYGVTEYNVPALLVCMEMDKIYCKVNIYLIKFYI